MSYTTYGGLVAWRPRVMTTAGYLGGLLDTRGGLLASAGGDYALLFGRDALHQANALVAGHPETTIQVLLTLAQFLGHHTDPATGEFAGAVPHMVYRQIPDGVVMPEPAAATIESWARKWGIELRLDRQFGRFFATYNTADAPALFVSVLASLHRLHPDLDVLSRAFSHHASRTHMTLSTAGEWVLAHIERMVMASDLGLYEIPNTNPLQTSPSGVLFDGFDSYWHPSATGPQPLNRARVAYVHTQAQAYEALLCGAELYPGHPDAHTWRGLAGDLRAEAVRRFELDRGPFPPAAIDRSADGRPRAVRQVNVAALELLSGRFLQDLPFAPDLVGRLVRLLYSPDVLTPVGARCLPLQYAASEGEYAPYQGSATVWPVMDWIIAQGLLNQGLYPLFHDLAVLRLAAGLDRSGSGIEFWPVHRQAGLVCYHPHQTVRHRHGLDMACAEMPQRDLGMSLSSGYAALTHAERAYPPITAGSWQSALVREALEVAEAIIPAAAGRHEAPIYIDTPRGRQLRAERARALGAPI